MASCSRTPLWILIAMCDCGRPPAPPPEVASSPPSAATAVPASLVFEPVALPGVTAHAAVDFIAYEPGRERVWVPVGNTGSADVFDIATRAFTRVDGFANKETEVQGSKRTMGPSSIAVGDGFVYVGNRATHEVCPVSAVTLTIGKCRELPSAPDAVAYVASAKEVWVTTPKDQTIVVLDVSKPDLLVTKATITLDGAPECYAVDASNRLFFTNLEDKNKTVVIDVPTHKATATWNLDCSSEGPRGIAVDDRRGFVYVACTDHVLVLDRAKNGSRVGHLDTGAGVDDIDWLQSQQRLYVAAGKSATLTVAYVNDGGQPVVVARGPTSDGARNAVVDAAGNVYVVDRGNARLLVFKHIP